MNSSQVGRAIQEQSKEYVSALYSQDTKFLESSVKEFLLSDIKRCLLIKTNNTQSCVLHIVKLLEELKRSVNNQKTLEKYLSEETFISWPHLRKIVRPLKVPPKFTNLFICEFPLLMKLEKYDENILSKIIERYNVTFSKKIILIVLHEGLLKECLKCIEMRAFQQIDLNNHKVISTIYANTIEAFWESVSHGHTNDVSELLKINIDINSSRIRNLTALHVAAEEGYKDLVLLLLRNGANILPDNMVTSPLHAAASCGHKDIILIFLKNDIDVDIKDYAGWTALHNAAFNGHKDVVKTLLEYGANINSQANKNRTALHVSAYNNKPDIVETLLHHGAKIDIIDDDGNTPLHQAVIRGSCDVVKILIERGAHIYKTNNSGEAPSDLIRNFEMGELLHKYL